MVTVGRKDSGFPVVRGMRVMRVAGVGAGWVVRGGGEGECAALELSVRVSARRKERDGTGWRR